MFRIVCLCIAFLSNEIFFVAVRIAPPKVFSEMLVNSLTHFITFRRTIPEYIAGSICTAILSETYTKFSNIYLNELLYVL